MRSWLGAAFLCVLGGLGIEKALPFVSLGGAMGDSAEPALERLDGPLEFPAVFLGELVQILVVDDG